LAAKIIIFYLVNNKAACGETAWFAGKKGCEGIREKVVMSETKALIEGNELGRADLSVIKERHKSLTTSRIVNLLLVLLFGACIVLHVVCLAVMVAKHKELVDKFDPDNLDDDNDEWCVLFMDYDDNTINFKNNNCHVVIYGSAALAFCAFLMIIFLLFRTAIFMKR